MRNICVILFALLLASLGQAQQAWMRTYGGDSADIANCVQQTSDGGYIVVGQTKSFGAGGFGVYLIKSLSVNSFRLTQMDRWQGSTKRGLQRVNLSPLVFCYSRISSKTNATGDTAWTRTYGGTGFDAGYCVEQTSDRGYIISGATSSYGAGSADVYLIKTNPSGDTMWTRTYGGHSADCGSSVQQTSDGGYVIAGYDYAVYSSYKCCRINGY